MNFASVKTCSYSRAKTGLSCCWLFLLILAVNLGASLSGLWAADKPPLPQVIILNSYHPGFTWSDKEVAGVLQELRRVYPKIDPNIEYLDTKRFPADEHLLRVKDYLAKKYHGYKFDLVIVLDNPALEMALNYRKQLFPGTPIVFAGINDFQPAMLAGQEKVTGVAEILNIAGTLNTALALHPGTTEIFVVTDYTISGKAARQEIQAALPRLPTHVDIMFAPPATMAELVEHIKRLPATAIIFISGFATDKAGQSFSASEGVQRLTSGAKVPAYIVHEARLGTGPVGGFLLGGEEEGRQAGEIALRVLAGTDPASIPVNLQSKARPMFDYLQLERFKIAESALPAGSIIVNRPSSFYEIHRSLVWGTAGVILALTVVVLVLGVNINRRRRAEKELEHHFRFLQNLLDTIPNPVFYKDAHGVYLGCNQALEEFLGLPKDGIVGKTVYDTYPKDLADKYSVMDEELFHHPGSQVYEFDMARSDGSRRSFIFNKATFFNLDGSLGGLIGVMTDITERKRAEEALQQSEARLRNLYETVQAGIVLQRGHGEILQANQMACEILGMSVDEVTGRTSLDTDWQMVLEDGSPVPGEEHPSMITLRTGQPIRNAVRGLFANDPEKMRWLLINTQPIIDPRTGNVSEVTITFQDITELKQAEEAVRKSEARYRLLFDSSNDAIFVFPLEADGKPGKFIEVNDVACQRLGYTRDELRALSPLEINAQKSPLLIASILRQLVDKGQIMVETAHLAREGRVIPVEISAKLFELNGRPTVLSIVRDITERQRAEAALRESEEKFRLVFEKAPIGIMHYDRTSTITDCNEKFAEIIGAPKEKFIGFNMMRQLQDEPMREAVAASLSGEVGYYEGDYLSVTAGKLTPVRAIYQPIFTPEGEMSGGITIFEDITARQQAEAALRESERLFRSLFENMLNACSYHKMIFEDGQPQDYIFLEVNSAFEALTGLRDVIGKKVSEVIPGLRESAPELFETYGRVALTGQPERFETYVKPLKMWVAVSVYSPEKEYFVTVFDVITERKRAEEELRLKEKLLDSASDSIFLHDLEGRFLYVNEAAYINRWYRKEELLSGQVSMLTTPESNMNRDSILKELLANGELVFESEHLRKDGSVIPVEIYARVLEVGGRELILSVARDITERKRAEELLQKERDQAQQYLDIAAVIMLVLDAKGRISLINKKGCETLGYEEREVIGQPWFDTFLPENDRDRIKAGFADLLAGRIEPWEYVEGPLLTKNGEERLVAWHNTILKDKNGEIIATLSSGEDITERKRAEEEVQTAAQKWRTTFDAITDAVFLMDQDGTILQCNQALADLVHKPFTDILGRHCFEVVHETAQHIGDCPMVRLRGTRQREELLLNRGDRWYKVGVDPILDEAGGLAGAVHIISDITRLMETERSLYRRTEELMLLNTIGTIVSRSLDLHEVLDDSLSMIQQSMFQEQSWALIFLMDETTGELKATGQQSVPQDHPCLGRPLKVGECLCGRAALQGEIMVSKDSCASYTSDCGAVAAPPHQDISLPLKIRDRLLGVLYVGVPLDQEVDERHLKLLEAIADQISVAVENTRLFEEVKVQSSQLRALTARMAEIEEAERLHLARELHDHVGQSLTTLSLYVTMLQEQMPREVPQEILTRLADAAVLVDQTADTVRDVMAELRPPVLDYYGLLAGVKWHGKQFSKSTGISVRIQGKEVVPRLNPGVEMALFRITQEALNNVAKHAQASRVTLTEEVLDDRVRLIIADNGIGFDQSRLRQPAGRHRWGLMTMSERALGAGGSCRIESQPGHGTKVIVEVSREAS